MKVSEEHAKNISNYPLSFMYFTYKENGIAYVFADGKAVELIKEEEKYGRS